MRYTVERDHSVWFVEDQGWPGSDCPRIENHWSGYPKAAVELRFRTLARAQAVADLLNTEWQEFEQNPE